MTSEPDKRTAHVGSKPYTWSLWLAIEAQEASQPEIGGVIILPAPKNDDEQEQLDAFLATHKAAAAKNERPNYDFYLEYGVVLPLWAHKAIGMN
jgi:hypothetical protein